MNSEGGVDKKFVLPLPLPPTRMIGLARPSLVKGNSKSTFRSGPLFLMCNRFRYTGLPFQGEDSPTGLLQPSLSSVSESHGCFEGLSVSNSVGYSCEVM
jgi:hypothetical protein